VSTASALENCIALGVCVWCGANVGTWCAGRDGTCACVRIDAHTHSTHVHTHDTPLCECAAIERVLNYVVHGSSSSSFARRRCHRHHRCCCCSHGSRKTHHRCRLAGHPRRDTLFSKKTWFSRLCNKLTDSTRFLGHVVGQQGRWLGWQNTTMLDTWAKTAIFFVRLSLLTHPSIYATLL
jgi:hypothetical protein